MSVKSRATITTDIATNLPDNTAGTITPELLRNQLDDLNDSSLNKTTDTNLMGVRVYDVTRQYYQYELTFYSGCWYEANADTVIGAFDPAYWDALAGNVYHTSLVIETASVLTLNTTPVTIVSAVSGKACVVLNSALSVVYNSVPYATNVNAQLITDTASIPQLDFLAALNATTSRKSIGRLRTAAIAAGETQLINNKALKVTVETGDPTAGNSQIKIDLFYTFI